VGAATPCSMIVCQSVGLCTFAERFSVCLFMTRMTAYVVHCTKGTCWCPIMIVLMLIRKSQLAQ
jgi:hypothetical protein